MLDDIMEAKFCRLLSKVGYLGCLHTEGIRNIMSATVSQMLSVAHEAQQRHTQMSYLVVWIVARVQLYKGVNFIDGMPELEVSICRGHLELCNEPVNFADEKANGKAFLAGLLDGFLSHQHDAFNSIHYQHNTIC